MSVKPLGPGELKRVQEADDSAAVDALMEKCNAALKKGFGASYGSVYVGLDNGVNSRVRSKVQNAFAAAGWIVTFESDQRDGASLTFREREQK